MKELETINATLLRIHSAMLGVAAVTPFDPDGVATGNCAVIAFRGVMEMPEDIRDDSLRLVHANVHGQERLKGQVFFHAWVEVKVAALPWVFDYANGNNIHIPAVAYRRVARAMDVVEYTRQEVFTMAARHMHYGPWCDRFTE